MLTDNVMEKLESAAKNRERGMETLRARIRQISRAELNVRKLLNKMVVNGLVYDVDTEYRPRLTRAGHKYFATVIDCAHKPEGKRKRHIHITVEDATPDVLCYTDLGPGRKCARETYFKLDAKGVVRLFKEEVLK
jgi:hypothetical protein